MVRAGHGPMKYSSLWHLLLLLLLLLLSWPIVMVCLADEALFSLPSTHPMVCVDLDRLRHIYVRRPWSSESIDNCLLNFYRNCFAFLFYQFPFRQKSRTVFLGFVAAQPKKKKKNDLGNERSCCCCWREKSRCWQTGKCFEKKERNPGDFEMVVIIIIIIIII